MDDRLPNSRDKKQNLFTDDDFDLELLKMSGIKADDQSSKLRRVKSIDSSPEIEESTTLLPITNQIN